MEAHGGFRRGKVPLLANQQNRARIVWIDRGHCLFAADRSSVAQAVDINGDGDIDLPELDIKLALIRTDMNIQVSEKKQDPASTEEE